MLFLRSLTMMAIFLYICFLRKILVKACFGQAWEFNTVRGHLKNTFVYRVRREMNENRKRRGGGVKVRNLSECTFCPLISLPKTIFLIYNEKFNLTLVLLCHLIFSYLKFAKWVFKNKFTFFRNKRENQ